jgi:hypothetical protein
MDDHILRELKRLAALHATRVSELTAADKALESLGLIEARSYFDSLTLHTFYYVSVTPKGQKCLDSLADGA